MKLYREYNFMEDMDLLKKLNIYAILLTIVFMLCTLLFAYQFKDHQEVVFEITLLNIIIFSIAFFVIVIIHELIHGIFFKLFAPTHRVKYGFKNGMAYATSPGAKFTKRKFYVIGLAPFVIITSVMVILFLMRLISPTIFVSITAFHAAACIGDFFLIYLLYTTPKGLLVEDTEVGINFYEVE